MPVRDYELRPDLRSGLWQLRRVVTGQPAEVLVGFLERKRALAAAEGLCRRIADTSRSASLVVRDADGRVVSERVFGEDAPTARSE